MKIIENIKVRDVMTRGVVTVPMDATLMEVAESLDESHITGVVVVAPDGEIMGIISEVDIIKAFNEDMDKLTAEDVMSEYVKTIDPKTTLKEAADVMKDEGIHRLVILSETGVGASDIPVGILCASDIIKEIVRRK